MTDETMNREVLPRKNGFPFLFLLIVLGPRPTFGRYIGDFLLTGGWKEDSSNSNDAGDKRSCSGGSRSIDCYPELTSGLKEGDILGGGAQEGRNAIDWKLLLWPGGEVPYVIDSEFTPEDIQKVEGAMRAIESKTCVKFTPRNGHWQYINIKGEKEKGCYAMVGRHLPFAGSLDMNLQRPECLKQSGTIQHELLHTLGLFHEQSRPDRDDHVNINWENIDKKYQSNFSKASDYLVSTYNVTYDYQSVMHYPKWAFSKNGKDTIEPKGDKDAVLGQREGATDGDLEKVRLMYNCKK